MGIFGNLSDGAVTEEVERVTNENNKEDEWDKIIAICDKAGKSSEDAKAYLKAIVRRLNNSDPHIAINAVTLLDACVKNSGKLFHIEVASREFENEFTKLQQRAHNTVSKKLRESLRRWTENEFKSDQQLNLIPSLYTKLKNQGLDFSLTEMSVKKTAPLSKDPNVVESQEEENEILKAIALSLKETTSTMKSTATGSVYPSINLTATTTTSSNSTPPKEKKKVRALYDFEAAEDNELTFKTGEIIFVIDDSDPNWWKGSNQRGEGLFPSNFVTKDLDVEPEKFLFEKAKKKVQFDETSESNPDREPETVEINEIKIDRLLHLFHEADPTNPETDTEEMLKLEREVNAMGPLIDAELERVDRKHAQLTELSTSLVEALSLYHTLMREPPQVPPKMPYSYSHMAASPQSLPGMGTYNGLPPPPPLQGMPPPNMHYATMAMMQPPPGIPAYMMQQPSMVPPGFPSGAPPQPTQSQHYMPTSSSTPK